VLFGPVEPEFRGGRWHKRPPPHTGTQFRADISPRRIAGRRPDRHIVRSAGLCIKGPQMNRVPLVALCWFAFWTGAGAILGRVLETPGTYTVLGFVFALLSMFAWPWILPDRLNEWMDE
jgi:hypothetical protein